MSYQVVARKWRPQRFDEVVGQDHISETLRYAVRNDRIAPVYLFTGIRGTGKTTLARIMVKCINCQNPAPDGEPCNACESCLEIMSGKSPDVIEIDGASNNSVNDVRNIKENISYRPVKSKYKVYIIDEVHMLSTSAFNALLKTLEEPPAHAVFVLATTDPQKIPTTVLSRCQRYDLKRLSMEDVVGQLEKIVSSEGIEYERDALYAIAREGEGSMRDSQTVLEQLITFGGGKLSEDIVANVLGSSDKESLRTIVGAMAKRDRAKGVEVAREIYYSGRSVEKAAKDILHMLHHIVLFAQLGNSSFLEVSDEEREWVESIAKTNGASDWLRLFRFWNEEYESIKSSDFSLMLFEIGVVTACNFPQMADFDSFLSLMGVGSEKAPAALSVPASMSATEVVETPSAESSEPEIKEKTEEETVAEKPVPESSAKENEIEETTAVESSADEVSPDAEGIAVKAEADIPDSAEETESDVQAVETESMEQESTLGEEVAEASSDEAQDAAVEAVSRELKEKAVPEEPAWIREEQQNVEIETDAEPESDSFHPTWKGFLDLLEQDDSYLYTALYNVKYEEEGDILRALLPNTLTNSMSDVVNRVQGAFDQYFRGVRKLEVVWTEETKAQSVADKDIAEANRKRKLTKQKIAESKQTKDLEQLGFNLKKTVVK